MENKLRIFFCNSLLPEVEQLMHSGNYPDVCLKSFPIKCQSGYAQFDHAFERVVRDADRYSKTIVITSSCSGSKPIGQASHRKIEIIRLEQCFEIFASLSLIYHLIKLGNYLVTNGWLRRYEHYIREWGFNEHSAKAFFGESVQQILLLDTGLSGDYRIKLNAFSSHTGLPFDVLPIGNSHLRMFVDTLVYKWRAETERASLNDRIATITRESADYSVLFSQMKRLIDLTDEELIAKEIAFLLDLLFMPHEICFQRTQDEKVFDKVCYKEATDPSILSSDNSLMIDISHRKELLGTYQVSGIAFPQFMPQYVSMKQLISQIGGLAIVNARKYTEIEEARRQLALSEAELRELNAAKDKFFSIIAHDLKGPFNSIIGYADILGEKIRRNELEDIGKYADIVLQSSNRAFNLLTNLLEWSRTQTGRMPFIREQFDLTAFVKEHMIFFHETAAHKGIALKRDVSEGLFVFADKSMIGTVIRNLLSNAIKFTESGGEVILMAKHVAHEIIISVCDNGVGLSSDRVNGLFRIEKSNTTSGTANEKGTGLGLILCKEFVEKHDGRIWVESLENKGSVFIFTLPIFSMT